MPIPFLILIRPFRVSPLLLPIPFRTSSVSAFKGRLNKTRETRMGFFVDRSTEPYASPAGFLAGEATRGEQQGQLLFFSLPLNIARSAEEALCHCKLSTVERTRRLKRLQGWQQRR